MGKLLFSTALLLGVLAACGGATSSGLFNNVDGGSDGATPPSDGGSGTRDGSTTPPGPPPADLTTCNKPGDCELGAKGCCGINCQPESELVAIRRGEAAALKAATCDRSGPIACPDCAARYSGNTQAFCEDNKCVVVDIRKHELAECNGNDECVLRYGTCCQSCSGGAIADVVAVKKGNEDDLTEQLCAGNEACPKCLPVFPPALRAVCNKDTKHCAVQQL